MPRQQRLSQQQLALRRSNAKPSYNDAKNNWAAPFIAAMEKENIIKGREPGVFDPEGKVTRAEMAAMLVKHII